MIGYMTERISLYVTKSHMFCFQISIKTNETPTFLVLSERSLYLLGFKHMSRFFKKTSRCLFHMVNYGLDIDKLVPVVTTSL